MCVEVAPSRGEALTAIGQPIRGGMDATRLCARLGDVAVIFDQAEPVASVVQY